MTITDTFCLFGFYVADIATELECQHRGGTCEFFVHCWLTGGLLQGTCIGLLRGCCHRTAKSANILTADYAGNTIDLTDLPQKNFGPVKNDPSEFLFQSIHIRPIHTIPSNYRSHHTC